MALCCTAPAYPYRGPSPSSSEPAASLRVHYSDIPDPPRVPPSVALHVYELGRHCASSENLESSYQGLVNLTPFHQDILIPSGLYVFFRVKFHGFEDYSTVSCVASGGFVPEPGLSYSMDFSARLSRTCVLTVREEGERQVRLRNPSSCQEGHQVHPPPDEPLQRIP